MAVDAAGGADAPSPEAVQVGPLTLDAAAAVGPQLRRAAKQGVVREAAGEARAYFAAAAPDDFQYRVRRRTARRGAVLPGMNRPESPGSICASDLC